ncbi:MAG: hypothetical protein ABW199_06245 [Caulobacterales bacterium]
MSAPLAGVLAAARAAPRRFQGPGQVVMLIAARSGEGVSTVARGAAEDAGAPVLLVDLDIKRSTHARYFSAHGGLGAPVDLHMNGLAFYRARDKAGRIVVERAVKKRRTHSGNVDVTAFDPSALPKDARLQVGGDPAYWDALRAAGVFALVDAPALDRAPWAAKLARHMDSVVLVVSGEAGAAPAAIAAREALTEAGANVIGIVFARASAPVAAIDKFMRQVG